MKKQLLKERKCTFCEGDKSVLHFRFIERNLVYYWEKCLGCKHSRRSNMSIEEWKKAIVVSDELQYVSKHHRKQKCHNGSDDPSNISLVPHNRHKAFHTLFGNMTTKEIVKYLNDVWIDPAWHITAEKKQFPITLKIHKNEFSNKLGNESNGRAKNNSI